MEFKRYAGTRKRCIGMVLPPMNLPGFDVSLGGLMMRLFFLAHQAPFFHLPSALSKFIGLR